MREKLRFGRWCRGTPLRFVPVYRVLGLDLLPHIVGSVGRLEETEDEFMCWRTVENGQGRRTCGCDYVCVSKLARRERMCLRPLPCLGVYNIAQKVYIYRCLGSFNSPHFAGGRRTLDSKKQQNGCMCLHPCLCRFPGRELELCFWNCRLYRFDFSYTLPLHVCARSMLLADMGFSTRHSPCPALLTCL
jgi:hypothetical protein